MPSPEAYGRPRLTAPRPQAWSSPQSYRFTTPDRSRPSCNPRPDLTPQAPRSQMSHDRLTRAHTSCIIGSPSHPHISLL